MYTMILFLGLTPADSSTHVWLMTIGAFAYFIEHRRFRDRRLTSRRGC